MLFSSMIFLWLFLPVVFIVSRWMGIRQQNIFLLAASLFFLCLGRAKICAFNAALHFFELELRYVVGTVSTGQAFHFVDRHCIESVIAGLL